MLFNSWTFVIFFLIVFVLYRSIAGWRARKTLLLVASYFFYAAWNPPYVIILLFSTILDWGLARRIEAARDDRLRRRLLILSLVANLGILGFFKYGNFFLDNFRTLLSAFHIAYQPLAFDIVLPIGISFYTFASLSYTVDVYRREVKGDASLLDYALFVSFFPHLVAGPIVRASQLLPQISRPREPTPNQIGWGVALLILGLFSKVVLADNIFAPVVDLVYANGNRANAMDAWAAVLGFSGQIYFDFSGYSLCAIGIALSLGFVFPDNFRYPYGARGFSDFWQRWHITLSTWLRDYLYIPLGGNRRGSSRTYFNLIFTMLIGGLWHGASWMFVLWGGLHGVYLAGERFLVGRGRMSDLTPLQPQLQRTFVTFIVVTLTWIAFRAPDAQVAAQISGDLFRFEGASLLSVEQSTLCYTAICVTLIWHLVARDNSLEERFGSLGSGWQTALLGLSLGAMYLVSGGDARAFIYFQF